jgi:hypothetical protein
MNINHTTATKNIKPMVFDLDIENAPPTVYFLINPSNFELKYTPKIAEQRVRWSNKNIGYIFQAHHDELDTLSTSGTSAMFVSENGITRVNRNDTLAFRNIQQIIALYRNNGININTKSSSSLNPCMIDSVGRVVITYDGFVYRGHFTSFSITENDDKPFNISFSFEFEISQLINIGSALQNSIIKSDI